MKKRMRKDLDRKGFTLVEVLVAFVLLLMVSQILLLGISFSAKVGNRSKELRELRIGIGEHLMEKSMCLPGTVYLELGDEAGDVEMFGWLYSGEEDTDGPVQVIWVEELEWPAWEEDAWGEER